jgi:HEPN domain-containing protein
MIKKQIVTEWFDRGDKDIRDAEFLFQHKRALETVSFHIQQAAEKYLKGFLISRGRNLEMIHDLVKLLQDGIKIDNDFAQFKMIAKKTK